MKKLILVCLVFLVFLNIVNASNYTYLIDNADTQTIDGNTSNVPDNTPMADRGWTISTGSAPYSKYTDASVGQDSQSMNLLGNTGGGDQIARKLVTGNNFTLNVIMRFDKVTANWIRLTETDDTTVTFGALNDSHFWELTGGDSAVCIAKPNMNHEVNLTWVAGVINISIDGERCFNRSGFHASGIKQIELASADYGGDRSDVWFDDFTFTNGTFWGGKTSDLDLSPPTMSNFDTNATNSTATGEVINISAVCDDNVAAGQIWYGKYADSIYTNSSSVDYTDNEVYTFNVTITELSNTDVNITMWCNDSSGNEVHSGIWIGFTVANADVTPTITYVYPEQKETYNNYDGWFNFTTNVNSVCTVHNTSWVLNSSNVTNFYYWNTGYAALENGVHLINTSCYNGTSTNATSLNNFTVDSVSPALTNDLKENTTITIDSLTIQANATDNIKLWSINVTVDKVAVNYTDNINTSTYTWDYTLDTSSYDAGKHNITWEVCDAHTAKAINGYKLKEDVDNKKITYIHQNKEISIEPKNKNHFDDVNTFKQKDKYSLKFTKKKSYINKEEDYIVKSTGKIFIVGDELYTGWLVIPSSKQWVDFQNNKQHKAKVKRVSDNEVIITTKADYFDSIGSLNCNNFTSFWYKTDIENLTYNNHYNYSDSAYARNLSYTLNLTCAEVGVTTLYTIINSSYYSNETLTCDNTPQILTRYYQHGAESTFNITFNLSNQYFQDGKNKNFGEDLFKSDLYNPVIKLSMNLTTHGFFEANSTINVTCNDTFSPIVTLNLTHNSTSFIYQNITSNTSKSNSTKIVDGLNNVIAICSDFFGSTTHHLNFTGYVQNIFLIDEKDNTEFDKFNLTSCRIYTDDNQTYYDFITNNRSSVNFSTTSYTKLRVELGYLNNIIINRYIDISLIDGDVRVCANKQGVTHYEQLLLSASERRVLMKNIFSDCYVAADYTRFAYQDSYLLKGHTIDSIYTLYAYDNGKRVELAGVDGSVSAYINIDNLEFAKKGFNLNIRKDSLSFQKNEDNNNEIIIYYRNLANDNTDVTLQITNLANNYKVYNSSGFPDVNEFTVYFNYATLSNVTNQTLFQADLTRTTTAGETYSMTRYFNIHAKTGVLQSGFAFAIALLLLIFGLTLAMTRITFSWFGIMIIIASLGFLSFAITTWYITMLMTINIIILVYIFIVMINQNYPSLT